MRIYLAVTKSKTPRIIAAETTHEDCLKRGNLLARGREFEVVEKFLIFDNYGTILNIMEGCSLEHIDFVIDESNAHLSDVA